VKKKRQFWLNLYFRLFISLRRSANAVLVRELQAKVDKGENIEFELQVKKLLVETEIFTKIPTVYCFC
jgi:hypothetical protein